MVKLFFVSLFLLQSFVLCAQGVYSGGVNDGYASGQFMNYQTQIGHQQKQNSRIFPNYFNKEQLTCELRHSFSSRFEVRIMNSTGILLYTAEYEESVKTVKLPLLKPGLYFLHLQSGQQSFNTKIVFN